MRRAAVGVTLFALTGCVHDGLWEGASARNRVIKSPLSAKQQLAHEKTAERVATLGRQVIDQNTFTGLEPIFHLVGVKESVLFHRGTEELFVSSGLVAQCKADDELAAVLCTELGRMVAEKRAERAMGRDVDPIAANAIGTETFPGGEAVGSEASPRPVVKAAIDPAQIAIDLMRGAGFDPAALERVEPLVRESERHDKIRKQMADSAPAPVWNK